MTPILLTQQLIPRVRLGMYSRTFLPVLGGTMDTGMIVPFHTLQYHILYCSSYVRYKLRTVRIKHDTAGKLLFVTFSNYVLVGLLTAVAYVRLATYTRCLFVIKQQERWLLINIESNTTPRYVNTLELICVTCLKHSTGLHPVRKSLAHIWMIKICLLYTSPSPRD